MRYNILSVDEVGITRVELSNILKNIDVQIMNVKDETEALNVLRERKVFFHAVVWTINSVDVKDFECIRSLKSKEAYKAIPVIIVSRFTDKRYIIRAIECGAVEYIAKPYDEESVLRKICKILGVSLERNVDKKLDEDIVTYNFSEMLNKEIKGASRGDYPLTIIMSSLITDAGNETGQDSLDGLINLLNRVLKTKLRETDSSFLYGQSNLVTILPFTNKIGAQTVEKKLQDIFLSHSMIRQRNTGFSLVSASVTFPDDGRIKGKLLEKLEMNFGTAIEALKKII